MAISKEELQLLITANSAGLRTEMAKATKAVKQFDSNVQQNSASFSANLIPSLVSASLITAGLSKAFDILGSSIGKVTDFISDSIAVSNKYQTALLGLQSVAARKLGVQGIQDATNAANSLAEDGLMGINDAALGLKNLLATGFNLEEATNLMLTFKDAAAFGRQSALGFGEAITSATEGVKNGNSILVDNAGITKNLSIILEEAGYSAQDLSRATQDVGVRQAIYNGILREGNLFQGDAAKLLSTTAGQASSLAVSFERLQVQIGNFFQPILMVLQQGLSTFLGAITGTMQDASTSIANLSSQLAGFVLGVIRLVGMLLSKIPVIGKRFESLANLSIKTADNVNSLAGGTNNFTKAATGATKAAKKLQDQLAGFDEMNVLSSPSGDLGSGNDYSSLLGNIAGVAGQFAVNAEVINTTADTLVKSVTGFGLNLGGVFANIGSRIAGQWNVTTNALSQAWDRNKTQINASSQDFLANLTATFTIWGSNFNKGIITPVLAGLQDVWDKHFANILTGFTDVILKLAVVGFSIYNKLVAPVVNWLGNILSPAFDQLGKVVYSVITGIGNTIGNFVTGVLKQFSNGLAFLADLINGGYSGVWNGFKKQIEVTFIAVRAIVEGIWNSIVATIKGSINNIIYFINQFTGEINKVIGRVGDFTSSVGLGRASVRIAPMNYLAAGGEITSPIVAQLGEQSKREVVLPLERNTGWADLLVQRLNEAGGAGGQPINLVVNLGGEKLLETIINGINDKAMITNSQQLYI